MSLQKKTVCATALVVVLLVIGAQTSPGVAQAMLTARADVRSGSAKEQVAKVTEPDWKVYHKTLDIIEELKRLAENCPHARVELAHVPGEEVVPERQVYSVVLGHGARSKLREMVSSALRERLKVVVVFGEHGRELISSEVALETVRLVCEGEGEDADAARLELRRTEFHLIPTIGASSRMLTEMGQNCERLNANGADLNRNWGFLWGKADDTTVSNEERPGTAPFSEFETRAVKHLVESVKPTAYITVHSGDRAILMPWDHRKEPVEPESLRRLRYVADRVVAKHCPKCRVGNVFSLFGYNAFGTAVDWAYGSAKVPFVFTWEIYGDLTTHIDDCFKMFNPVDRSSYDAVVSSWSKALFTLAEAVHTAVEAPESLPEPRRNLLKRQTKVSTPSQRSGFPAEWRRRGQGGTNFADLKSSSRILQELLATVAALGAFMFVAHFVRTRVMSQGRKAPFLTKIA